MIGAVLGNYEIVQQIGKGGMGVVYLGRHTLLGRQAAIKVLLPALSLRPEVVNRFFNEARAATTINDPGIVQVFDFGYHADGSAFIVMELLDGEPMDKRLRRIGRFDPAVCLRLMRLICTSLRAAHACGIVHRDLKPENIFIVRDPAVPGGERVKLLDFGIAKLTADEPGTHKTRTGALLGTPVYMSPEQCDDAGNVDHRSDIYTIGCVMFTMLTGRPPFESMRLGELIVAHLREPPPLAASRVPELPDVVDGILQRCLRKLPDERFQSMSELVGALEFAEQMLHSSSAVTQATGAGASLVRSGAMPSTGAPPTTLGISSGERMPPPTRARGRLVLSIAAVAVIATVVVMLAARRGGDGDDRAPAPRRSAAEVPAPAAQLDAAPATATPAMPAVELPAPTPTGPPDAGTSIADIVDAAQPAPQRETRETKRRKATPRRDHDSETTPPFDRGD